MKKMVRDLRWMRAVHPNGTVSAAVVLARRLLRHLGAGGRQEAVVTGTLPLRAHRH